MDTDGSLYSSAFVSVTILYCLFHIVVGSFDGAGRRRRGWDAVEAAGAGGAVTGRARLRPEQDSLKRLEPSSEASPKSTPNSSGPARLSCQRTDTTAPAATEQVSE